MRGRRRTGWLAALVALLLVGGCGGTAPGAPDVQAITLYTCVSDTTIQPVIVAFEKANPGRTVKLYRAPTGDLNARIAGDVRSGRLKADVVWACDPLTMQDYVDQGLVGGWTPQTDIKARFRTNDYVGVAVLYMVAVTHTGFPPPKAWSDLTGPAYGGKVALPDPEVAASALGALGYFAQNPDYGLDFYARLKRQGAVQVSTPNDVTNGVAEGQYRVGFTIANAAYAAQKKGSPIEVSWPKPGAVAIYGPAAVSRTATDPTTAKAFVSYLTSSDGQRVIADAKSYPTLAGVPGPSIPADAPIAYPNWQTLADQKADLLTRYRHILGH